MRRDRDANFEPFLENSDFAGITLDDALIIFVQCFEHNTQGLGRKRLQLVCCALVVIIIAVAVVVVYYFLYLKRYHHNY